MKNSIIIAFVLFVIGFVISLPLITIWALNTLFALGIPFTIWTWLATFWLQLTIVGASRVKYKE